MRGVLLVKIVIIVFEVTSAAPQCDMTTNIELDEGNMGQSADFNWLGVVQVFLNDSDAMQVAVTGIVLVKTNRALVSADDIVRIPKRIFKHDTRAMFISHGDNAVYYSLVSYVTHPEYQTETFNSIAIILLNIGGYNPLVPVCFPIGLFDTSYLYLTGFTDDYEILEKTFYRIQYMDRPKCEEFYENEGLVVENRQPISYLCGKGHRSGKRCVWNNGMALVSNSSGWFTLIGLSIHGPGCAAPARFISMLHYSTWIQEVTRDRNDQEDDYDYISPPHFRRTNGLRSRFTEFIPIHKTFTALRENESYETNLARGGTWITRVKTDKSETTTVKIESTTPEVAIRKYDYFKYPFPVNTMEYFKITPSATQNDTVWITPFHNKYENPENACSNEFKELQYREEFNLKTTPGMVGSVTYEFSMYDLVLNNCSCVTLEVDCSNRSEAYLEFKEVFEHISQYDPLTPDEVLQFVVVTERSQEIKKHTSNDKNPHFKPTVIESDAYIGKELSYHLYIRFNFRSKAVLKFKMFSNDNDKRIKEPVTTGKPPLLRKKMHYWSSSRPVDKSVRAAALVVDHEVVLDTVSEARRSDVTPGVVIIGCLLISAFSTRILFI